MAGSWGHITDDQGRFRGLGTVENLGDAYEALEECYGMVWLLASQLEQVTSVPAATFVNVARSDYLLGIERSPGRAGGDPYAGDEA